jgi:thiol-disulfide isomerase/thioredoxin
MRHSGANDANRDTPVARCPAVAPERLGLPALLLASLLAACSPRPPADVTIAVREGGGENEPDLDAEATDALAPSPARAASAADGPLVWLGSEEEALERGLAERRPVLVHFETEWCADCRRMVSETFGDPRVKTRAGRFVAVRIDATNDEDPQVSAALSKYAVVSVPTLILLDSSGREQRRFTELVGPDTLLTEIDRVR